MARFRYISKQQTYFAIFREFYFHETSHMLSFAKIRPSQKFPDIQYIFFSFEQIPPKMTLIKLNLIALTLSILVTPKCALCQTIKSPVT